MAAAVPMACPAHASFGLGTALGSVAAKATLQMVPVVSGRHLVAPRPEGSSWQLPLTGTPEVAVVRGLAGQPWLSSPRSTSYYPKTTQIAANGDAKGPHPPRDPV